MIDIIKLLPHVPTSFSSNKDRWRSKPIYQRPNVLKPIPSSNNISQHDSGYSIYGTCLGEHGTTSLSRLLDVSTAPYGIHRKVTYQQLSKDCPSRMDLTKSEKSKQRRKTSKDTSTTTSSVETHSSSQPSVSTSDTHDARLFDTLSKHFTIKAEPLRPSTNSNNNPTDTQTSWQKYWTATHTPRRRKDPNVSESVFYRPKREPSVSTQPQVVVIRDSTYPYCELDQNNNRVPLTSQNNETNNSSNTVYISTTTVDKLVPITKENHINKASIQVSTIELAASSLIPSSYEINSTVLSSKSSTIMHFKSIDKRQEKLGSEKSSVILSPSSKIKNDSQIIANASKVQIQSKPITTKFYKISLPSAQPKLAKIPPPRKSRSKSIEKQTNKTTSTSRRKSQISKTRKSGNKRQSSTSLTRTKTTTKSRSTSKQLKLQWTAPYVGFRVDPPAPPCSPSIFSQLQDSDADEYDSSYEKSDIGQYSSVIGLEN